MLKKRSACPNSNVRATDSTLVSRLWCDSMTPLASPVVPDVKMSTARSCGSTGGVRGGAAACSRCAWSQCGRFVSASSDNSRSTGSRDALAAANSGRWRASPIACVASALARISPTSCSFKSASSGTTTAPTASTAR